MNQHVLISLPLLLAVTRATSTGIALLVKRIAYRPLRRAPRMTPLITAIGASFFLQHSFRGIFGAGVHAYPDARVLVGE